VPAFAPGWLAGHSSANVHGQYWHCLRSYGGRPSQSDGRDEAAAEPPKEDEMGSEEKFEEPII